MMLCFALMSCLTLVAKPFQGKVVFTYKARGFDGTMTMLTSGQKVRMDAVSVKKGKKEWYSLLYNGADEITMIWHDESKYATIDTSMLKEVFLNTKGIAGEQFEKKQTSIGETKKILEHECFKYFFKDDGNNIEMWVSHTLGTFPEMSGMFIPHYIGERDLSFFPLEISGWNKHGEALEMKVTEISRQIPADDVFTIPTNYTKASRGKK